jgi:predicted AAA+ superfamily ATPase
MRPLINQELKMAWEGLSMRKIREVLRLKSENHLSLRQIAKSRSIEKSTVQEYFDRAQKADPTWPLAPELDNAATTPLLKPS